MADILVVEDDPDVGEALVLLLEDDGHQVVLATTGAAALTACARCRPALVIVDVSLPGGMDGLELIRALRADPGLRQVPIVVASARAYGDDVAAGVAAGADDYLVKPFDPARLLSLVAEAVTDRPLGRTDVG